MYFAPAHGARAAQAKKFGGKSSSSYALVCFNGVKRARTPNVQCKSDSAFFGEEFDFDFDNPYPCFHPGTTLVPP